MFCTIAQRRVDRRFRNGKRRFGFSIIEVAAGAAMLAVLLALIAQLLVAVRQHSRRIDDRAAILRAAENAMEQFTAGPWASITAGAASSLRLPAGARRRWPGARIIAEVVETSDPGAAKPVTSTIKPAASSRERSLTLTSWVFPAGEALQ
jgi:type II secretory pathway pseudopilin PulG